MVYLFLPHQLVFCLYTDINGSVIAVTDTGGYLDGITNYGAYGKRQGSAISRIGYAGEWTDPTTTYTYLRARWYDPSAGSFLSIDPLYELTQESYGYANGNPLLLIDPSGLSSDLSGWTKWWAGDHLSFADTQGFQNVSDGISGFADEVTFGGTNAVRDLAGINNVVEKCSTSYKVGGYTGVAGSFVTPAGVAKQTTKVIAKKAVTAKKSSNKVYNYMKDHGKGHDDLIDARNKFGSKETYDYLNNPGAFAEAKGYPLYNLKNPEKTNLKGPKEIEEFNAIGDLNGCHSCGTKIHGNKLNWGRDHQPPTQLIKDIDNKSQEFYPHCKKCQSLQGGLIRKFNK